MPVEYNTLMHADDTLKTHLRILEPQEKALKRLGIETVSDLLYHFPARYVSMGDGITVTEAVTGDKATFFGTVTKLKIRRGFRSRIPMAEGMLDDGTGKIKLIWMHQPYIAKMIPEGSSVKVSGKLSEKNGSRSIINPEIEVVPQGSIVTAGSPLFKQEAGDVELFPVYPETRGVTSRWVYHALQKLFSLGAADVVSDPIPEDILKRYSLPSLKTALVWIHTPKNEKDSTAARKRFAFEEVFLIQLKKQQERAKNDSLPTWNIKVNEEKTDDFVSRFPFTPTKGQTKAVSEITDDFLKPNAMSRLLEGDVGSGKTFVAATTAHAVVTSRPDAAKDFGNLQVAYMAPTEILATQHFESFIEYFRDLPIQIGLLTSSGCKKFPSKVNPGGWTDISRPQLLKWVANGEIPILIGTHALIQKSVKFKHLAYVIIDEQHRFGTSQRMALARGHMRTETQTDAEKTSQKTPQEKLLYKDLTYTIRDVLFTVRKELGLGHKELVYQRAIEEEFKKRGINFKREVRIPVYYQKKEVGIYQPDFVVDEKVILELKSLPFIGQKEKKQLWTYLKGSTYSLALLANFGSSDLTIERVIYEQARTSASSPHESAKLPHLLSMTATPIPRTLALTIYGDLDLTLLDEMPAGRKEIITKIVPPSERKDVYEHIRKEIATGRQAYVICPRIEAPQNDADSTQKNSRSIPHSSASIQQLSAWDTKSVEAEAERLSKEVFPELSIGTLHGKMPTSGRSTGGGKKTKESVMEEFSSGKIDILVATSVVEVGVNVPNATTIVIEGAERFGLSQLHQLRGRVLRSTNQAYCFLFSESKGQTTVDRLKALTKAKNGFELAEHDLSLRGAGELYGGRQWGISDVGMEALRNLKMVEAARNEARTLIEKDPELKGLPLLREAMLSRDTIHFE